MLEIERPETISASVWCGLPAQYTESVDTDSDKKTEQCMGLKPKHLGH